MRRVTVVLVAILLICILSPGVFSQEKQAGEEPKKSEGGEAEQKKNEAAIKVKKMEPFTYCALEMKGSYDQHATAFQTLYGAAGEQGLDMNAVPFGIYWSDPESTLVEELLWEVGLPVTEKQKVSKPLKVKEWKHTEVVSKHYTGSFAMEKMSAVYCEIYGWIGKNGYVPAGPVMEKYMSMPVPDESGVLSGTIEIMVPVEKTKK